MTKRLFRPVDNRSAFALADLALMPLKWLAETQKAQRHIDLDNERIYALREQRRLNALKEEELAAKIEQAHNQVVIKDLEIERLQLQNLAMRRQLGLAEEGDIASLIRNAPREEFAPTIWGPSDPLLQESASESPRQTVESQAPDQSDSAGSGSTTPRNDRTPAA